MRIKDPGKTLLPTDRRWQCTRRSCGCWRSVHQAEQGTRPRCPICGSEMKLTTHAEAGNSRDDAGYPVFFYAVSVIGAVALLLLLIYLMVYDGGFRL